MLAMTASGSTSAAHIGTFVGDLEPQDKEQVLTLYQAELSILFSDEDVVRWMALFPDQIAGASIRLASHLCESKTNHAFEILQISRVTQLPEELDIFCSVCEQFLKSDKAAWVNESI